MRREDNASEKELECVKALALVASDRVALVFFFFGDDALQIG